jgi:hypothetical protein
MRERHMLDEVTPPDIEWVGPAPNEYGPSGIPEQGNIDRVDVVIFLIGLFFGYLFGVL